MNKENFKKGLIGLGVGVLIITGICAHFLGEKDYVTYEEYIATIEAYNRKIEEIETDCENDIRCYEGKVVFRAVKNKKDILNQLNQWIEDDVENPNTYKLKSIKK